MTTLQKAIEILGEKNVFGYEQWKKFYEPKDGSTKIDAVPDSLINEVPWDEATLANPGLVQPHFLFLGLSQLRAPLPINIWVWNQITGYGNGFYHQSTLGYNPDQQRYRNWKTWLEKELFAQRTCETRWYLMPVECALGTLNLAYDQQVACLPPEYEVCGAVERATGNFLYHFSHITDKNKWLDGSKYSCNTSDISSEGKRIYVGPGSAFGLSLNQGDDKAYKTTGLATARRLPGGIPAQVTQPAQASAAPVAVPPPAPVPQPVLPPTAPYPAAAASQPASVPPPGVPAIQLQRAQKSRTNALLLEVLLGIIGLPGFGWIYAGRGNPGWWILGSFFVWGIIAFVLAVVTGAVSAICTVPIGIAVVVTSSILLNKHMKSHPELFG